MEIPHFWSSIFKSKIGYRWTVVRCVLSEEGAAIGEIAKGWAPTKGLAELEANNVLIIILKAFGQCEIIIEKE